MYPADRMLRDRMLGSMMVSSASGVFRMRPEIHIDTLVLCDLATKADHLYFKITGLEGK